MGRVCGLTIIPFSIKSNLSSYFQFLLAIRGINLFNKGVDDVGNGGYQHERNYY